MSERLLSRAPSPSFSPNGSSTNDSIGVTLPSRSTLRSFRFLLVVSIVFLLFVELEIFDDAVLGYRSSTYVGVKNFEDDDDFEELDNENAVNVIDGHGKRRNPVVLWRWGTVIDCCPLRLGSMFRKGESTLYDYLTDNLWEVIDKTADDNFFCEFTLGALKNADDIIMDMNIDHMIRNIYLNSTNRSVKTETHSEPVDFVMEKRVSSSSSPSENNLVQVIDIANILHLRSHKCTQGILEYLNNQTTPMILLHGSAYTADNCGDGGIVAVGKIVEMLESPNVLMYISSVSVLLHGSVREIDRRLGSSPKTLILPSGLHSSINSHSVYRYLRNIDINRLKKKKLIHISSAKVPLPVHEYLSSTFKSSFESSNNPGIDYFRSLSKSKFVLCTDIWTIDESLLVGAIPIVETSTNLNYVYWNLPVMFLDSFRSITTELLDDAYECFTMHAHKYKYDQLTMKYWRDTISFLLQGNSSIPPVSSSFDNHYCDYRNGIPQRWNETVVGRAILKGDKQSALDIRDKLDIFRLPKEKYEIYRRLRHRRSLRVAN